MTYTLKCGMKLLIHSQTSVHRFVSHFIKWVQLLVHVGIRIDTVKPVCNDHLFNKIYYLWFIQ